MNPNDAIFGAWPLLADVSQAPLLEAIAGMKDLHDAAAIMRLRTEWPDELVRTAIELVIARRKAAEKFNDPQRLIADPVGIEQASSFHVARHKARRFAGAGCDQIIDLCCGIGGDAMALRDVCPVLCIDRNPHRAWMARHNAKTAVAIADVTTLPLGGQTFHIDPDRRSAGRRLWRYQDMQPGPAFIDRLAHGNGAVKLSPAVNFAEIPSGEVEIISHRGTLVQAVLWTGRFARHPRTATSIDSSGSVTSLAGEPAMQPPIAPPMRYLLTVDPAVERADLIGQLCKVLDLPMIHSALGLLSSDTLVSSPWLTPFELIEQMPWRIRRIRQWLATHDGGIVEVKTRGGAVDTDLVQRQLRGEGSSCFTVFVLRFDQKLSALITRRIQ